jgi:hypothetical protein
MASAHHTTIDATAVCDANGQPVIEFTSTSWSSGVDGENSRIDILFDGVVVSSGAYVLPENSFSGSAPAPAGSGAGDIVEVGALAVDNWGNGSEGGQLATMTVMIPEQGCETPDLSTGRFTGGGHQIRVGAARVTRGLTIHCDLALSNNLEVNWGGNQFHMTEHLETVACTDDPAIVQAPPPAPLDTLVGVGTGRYNGTDGYTIEFTLVDAGEPGGDDQAALHIYRTADPSDVVLDVPLQLITGGNLQAHYDQPHS